jgi:Sec7-like guanine-nucleotide exchange factor
VAVFLRAQADQLDKAQLGELLGHHEDFAIAVMHAWVDSEPSMAGQAIDQSLRRLLGGFRLPGEAQKIDRIMEKFAEVCFGFSAQLCLVLHSVAGYQELPVVVLQCCDSCYASTYADRSGVGD